MKRLITALLVSVLLPAIVNAQITPGSKDIGAVWMVGDSITQGNADASPTSSPRSELFNLLDDAGYSFTFTGHHRVNSEGLPVSGGQPSTDLYRYHSGISGNEILNLTTRLRSDWSSSRSRLSTVKPNVIMIMLGTNDINNGAGVVNAPDRLKNYVDLIYNQPGIGDPTVFVANIPPIRTSPDKPERVDAFNGEIPGIVNEQRILGRDVNFIDMYSPLNNDYDNLMRSDNLHPNGLGNVMMAQQWFGGVESAVLVPEPASSMTMIGIIFIAMSRRRRQRA